jgi:hypothetical protein
LHAKIASFMCIRLFLLTLYSIIALNESFIFLDALASSPSFPRQEIRDNPFDLIDVTTQEEITAGGKQSIDTRGVNYFSDGDVLNATIWLNSPFNEIPDTDINTASYGMYIDSDSDKDTGWQGVDYQVEIQWNNKMKTWIKIIVEYSSQGYSRYLDVKENYTGFFDKHGANYVLLPLDLDVLTSPSKYRVIFYAQEIRDSTQKVDFTNWVNIPPPEFTVSTSPNYLSLRPGEEEYIELKINSTTGFEPTVMLFAKNRTNGLELEFGSNQLNVPSYGMVTLPLQIRLSESVRPGQYTTLVFANGSFQSESIESLMETGSPAQDIFTIPRKSENLTKYASLIITIQEPLTFEEKLSNFWSVYGSPMNFVYGIAAGIAPWIYLTIKKRFSKNKKGVYAGS